MAHTYTSSIFHCVFSTKNRAKLIADELRPRLWSYMGGIAREHSVKAVAIGGTDDHVHLLMGLPATLPLSKAIQLIKGGSSKWIRETFAAQSTFEWQEGYGAFSIGVSAIPDTVAYIENQAEHHRDTSF